MFQYATSHPKRKALLTIKNNQDLTPINLAAKLGRKDLFEKMLDLQNIVGSIRVALILPTETKYNK
jgi:hypothetical protein